MELFEQCASYPVEEWLFHRRSRPGWEALLPTDQMMMSYELLCASTGSLNSDKFLEENPVAGGSFPGSCCEGFCPALLGQEVGLTGGYCHVRDQLQAQAVMDNSYGRPSCNFLAQEDSYMILPPMEDVFDDAFEASMEILGACSKAEQVRSSEPIRVLSGSRSRTKRLKGQPSKNLMAERRRRKRLNDRLSMLRSIIPRISKMDRTSILGDAIDYMKELLEKIRRLQDEIKERPDQVNMVQLLEDTKPNAMLARNSPKFNVERKNEETRVEICCSGKPELLLSTMSTLEALGLEIRHCVISCFSDFALQASCSQELGRPTMTSPEDIKQALFRNAGYGGSCL